MIGGGTASNGVGTLKETGRIPESDLGTEGVTEVEVPFFVPAGCHLTGNSWADA
jgi:hypothetical protein